MMHRKRHCNADLNIVALQPEAMQLVSNTVLHCFDLLEARLISYCKVILIFKKEMIIIIKKLTPLQLSCGSKFLKVH